MSKLWIFGISEGVLDDLLPVIDINKRIELELEFDPEWELYADMLRPNLIYFSVLKKLNL